VLSSGSTSAFLTGHLVQEGRQPLALLTAAPGRWRRPDGAHVLAVTDGLLWLSQPRLVGGPSIASVPLGDVGTATLQERRGRRRLQLVVHGRQLRWTALDDAEACRAFVTALERVRS